MADSKDLIQQVAQEIEASSRTSPTPPGQSDPTRPSVEAHVEAINQVFALFRLNYHNQYYAAYPDAEQLNNYLTGRLSGDESRFVGAHLAEGILLGNFHVERVSNSRCRSRRGVSA